MKRNNIDINNVNIINFINKFYQKLNSKFEKCMLVFLSIILIVVCSIFSNAADDEVSPQILGVLINKGIYSEGQDINLHLLFSEDVYIKRNENVSNGIISANLNSPNVQGFKYISTFSGSKLLVKKGNYLTLTYSLGNGENVTISEDNDMRVNIALNDLVIEDLSENELEIDVYYDVTVDLDITTWDNGHGYVSFGSYPNSLVDKDSSLQSELEEYVNDNSISSGSTFAINEYDSYYVEINNIEDVDVYDFYLIKPIIWKVLSTDKITSLLLSDNVIDKRKFEDIEVEEGSEDSAKWSCDDSNHMRAFLNDTFLNRAFNSFEKEKIKEITSYPENNGSAEQGDNVINKVTLPTIREMEELYSNARISLNTDYAKGVEGYFLRNVGKSGSNYITVYNNSSDEFNKDGIKTVTEYGIRPMITVPNRYFKFGTGSYAKPYSVERIKERDVTPPSLVLSKVETDNPISEDYGKSGTKITATLKFDEVLKNAPTVCFKNEIRGSFSHDVVATYNDASKIYTASYTLTGTEQFEEGEMISVKVKNISDSLNNTVDEEIEINKTATKPIKVDFHAPCLLRINVNEGDYKAGDIIGSKIITSEDVVAKRNAGAVGTLKFDICKESDNSVIIKDLCFTNSSSSGKIVLSTVSAVYEATSDIKIDATLSTIKANNFRLENMTLTDLAGNELDLEEHFYTAFTKYIEKWNEGNGYVNFGEIPGERIKNEGLKNELSNYVEANSIPIDTTFNFRITKNAINYDYKFLYAKNGEFYKFEKILWRVIDNNDEIIRILSDKIVDAKEANSGYNWGINPSGVPLSNVPFGDNIRLYLNSDYVKNDENENMLYEESAFFAKAFNDDEREYIVSYTQTDDIKDFIYPLTWHEYNDKRYGFNTSIYTLNSDDPILQAEINDYVRDKYNNKGVTAYTTYGYYFVRDSFSGGINKSRYDNSGLFGCRITANVSIEAFDFGSGSEEDPFRITSKSSIKPNVINDTETISSTNPFNEKYAARGTEITYSFKTNKELAKNPTVIIGNQKATFVSESNNTFVYKYTFDGTEGLDDKSLLKLEIEDLFDVDGEYTSKYVSKFNNTITYDITPPTITNLVVVDGTYDSPSVLQVSGKISENITVVKIDEDLPSNIVLHVLNGTPGLEGGIDVKYTNTSSIKKSNIGVQAGINFSYTVGSEDSISSIRINTQDEENRNVTSLTTNNIKIYDYAGNELKLDDYNDLPNLQFVKNITLFTSTNGYIKMGEYPQSRITDANIISQIKESGVDLSKDDNEGKIIEFEGKKYLYDKFENFYKIEPIIWKVYKMSGADVLLASDMILDSAQCLNNTTGLNIENFSTIKQGLREFLSRRLDESSSNYYDQDFLKKLFSDNELSYVKQIGLPIYDDITSNVVGLASNSEYAYANCDSSGPYYYLTEDGSVNNGVVAVSDGRKFAYDYNPRMKEMGVRLSITVPMVAFRYGEGIPTNPYSIDNYEDNYPAIIEEMTVVTDNSISKNYVKVGAKITANVKFNKTLKRAPSIQIGDENFVMNSNGDCKYSYIFTVPESYVSLHGDGYEIPIYVKDIVDNEGNITNTYEPFMSKKIIFDNTSPKLKEVSMIKCELKRGDNLSLKIMFDEDIVLRCNDTQGNILIDLFDDDEKTLDGLIYNYSSMSDQMIIPEKTGLAFTKIILDADLGDKTGIKLYPTVSNASIRNMIFNDITVTDKAGNPLIVDASKDITIYNNITLWNESSGYIQFGRYPKTQIKNEELITKLAEVPRENSLVTLNSGDFRFIFEGQEYYYSSGSGKYFKVEPLLWKVTANDGFRITALTYDIVDANVGYNPSDTYGIPSNENRIINAAFNEEECDKLEIVYGGNKIIFPEYKYYSVQGGFTSEESKKAVMTEYADSIGKNGGYYYSDPRLLIKLPISIFNFGEGTLESPFTTNNYDKNAPSILNVNITNSNEASAYMRVGSNISVNVEFDEELKYPPQIEIFGCKFDMNVFSEENKRLYTYDHVVDGTEGLNEGDYVSIKLYNMADLSNNMLDVYVPESINNKVIYDCTNPRFKDISALVGKYEEGENLSFRFRFNEDVLFKKEKNIGKLVTSIKDKNVDEIVYTFQDTSAFEKRIESSIGISGIFPVGFNPVIITPEDDDVYRFDELKFVDLEITDLAGNPLNITYIPNLTKTLYITRWDQTNGYVLFGSYPSELITNSSLIDELNGSRIEEGKKYLYSGNYYLKQDGKYYRIRDIMWRVLQNDGIDVLLLSEDIIDSTNIISLLSSNSDAAEFKNQGFLFKAFSDEEKEMMNKKGNDYAWTSSISDVQNSMYALTSNEVRKSSFTDYAKSTVSESNRNYYLYTGDSSKYYVDSNGSIINNNYYSGAIGVRPMISVPANSFRTGNGTKQNPYTINSIGNMPMPIAATIETDNVSGKYVRGGNTITASITFDQYLSKIPKILIGGYEANISKNFGTTYTASYTVTGREAKAEYEEFDLVIGEAVSLKGYTNENYRVNVPNKILFDVTSPTIEYLNIKNMPFRYKDGDEIEFELQFSEGVNIALEGDGNHIIKVGFEELSGEGATFSVNKSSKNVLKLNGTYVVKEEDYTKGLTPINVTVEGLKIKDYAGNSLNVYEYPVLTAFPILSSNDLDPVITPNVGEETEQMQIEYTVDFGRKAFGTLNVDMFEVENGQVLSFSTDNSDGYNKYKVNVKVFERGKEQIFKIKEGAFKDDFGIDSLEGSCSVMILKKDISEDISALNATFNYDKSEKEITPIGIPVGTEYKIEYEGREDTEYSKQVSAPINAGKYVAIVSIVDSDLEYRGSKRIDMEILPKEIVVKISVNDKEKYEDANTDAEIVISPLNRLEILPGDIVDFEYESALFMSLELGLQEVQVKGVKSINKNYFVSIYDYLDLEGNVIEKDSGIILDNIVMYYNGSNVNLNATCMREGATFDYTIVSDGETVSNIKDAGIYYVTTKMKLFDRESYKNTTVTIKPIELDLNVVVSDKEYDGTTNANSNVSVEPINVLAGESCNVTFDNAIFDNANVGNDKMVQISGLKSDNKNYQVKFNFMNITGNIISKGKLTSDIQSTKESGALLYENDIISLSYDVNPLAKIFYYLNENSFEELYINSFKMKEDIKIRAFVRANGYDDSDTKEFIYILRNANRLIDLINSDSTTDNDLKDILNESRDVTLLGIDNEIIAMYSSNVVFTDEDRLSICKELKKTKYVDKYDFNKKFEYVVNKFVIEKKITNLHFDSESEDALLFAAEIENAKIDYEKLDKNVKESMDTNLSNTLESLYAEVLSYYNGNGGNIAKTSDNDTFKIYGFVSKFDIQDKKSRLSLEVTKNQDLLNELTDNNAYLGIYGAYDIKVIEKYVANANTEEYANREIQPKPNEEGSGRENVIIKLEIPMSYQNKAIKVYHFKNGNTMLVQENEVEFYSLDIEDRKLYVVFETDGFSNFAVVYQDTYKVDIKKTSGGNVHPLGSLDVIKGDSITFQIDALPGYMIREVKVNGVSKNIQKADSDSFTLTNIMENTNVEVVFVLLSNINPSSGGGGGGGSSGGGGGSGGSGKTTIVEQEVIIPNMIYKYMSGYTDGTFKPNNMMTRSEVVTVMAKLDSDFNEDKETGYKMKFNDVKEESWYYKYVGFCYEKGYISGYKDGTFKPTSYVSRSEFVSMLCRMKNIENVANESKFSDVKGTWFEKYVASLEKLGFVSGLPDGTFGSTKALTRAEACVIINNVFGRSPNKIKIAKIENFERTFKDVTNTKSWYYADVMSATNDHDSKDY